MRKLKRWIIDNKNHEKYNTFLLTIICHGNKQGHLLDKNKSKAWDTEEFIGDLCEVEALIGKPKILTIQCCRGCKNFPTVIFLRCLGGLAVMMLFQIMRDRGSIPCWGTIDFNPLWYLVAIVNFQLENAWGHAHSLKGWM